MASSRPTSLRRPRPPRSPSRDSGRPQNLPLPSSVPSPPNHPTQLPYTSGTHSGTVAYRGSGTARAKPVHGRSEPLSKGQIGAVDDDETSCAGTSCWWLRAQNRLVVSARWCILKSVREAQLDDESGALPGRFIGQNLAGLGDGIDIERVTIRDPIRPFQMLGTVQDLLAGVSSTDARGQKTPNARAARGRKSAPRRPVECALRGMISRGESPRGISVHTK